MEKATHAKISNNAPFLVSILENARKTHMGIFSVFSIALVPDFSQNTTFVEDKNGDPKAAAYMLTSSGSMSF
jgi:hypothetical protein